MLKRSRCVSAELLKKKKPSTRYVELQVSCAFWLNWWWCGYDIALLLKNVNHVQTWAFQYFLNNRIELKLGEYYTIMFLSWCALYICLYIRVYILKCHITTELFLSFFYIFFNIWSLYICEPSVSVLDNARMVKPDFQNRCVRLDKVITRLLEMLESDCSMITPAISRQE